jgi:hypothetical protein
MVETGAGFADVDIISALADPLGFRPRREIARTPGRVAPSPVLSMSRAAASPLLGSPAPASYLSTPPPPAARHTSISPLVTAIGVGPVAVRGSSEHTWLAGLRSPPAPLLSPQVSLSAPHAFHLPSRSVARVRASAGAGPGSDADVSSAEPAVSAADASDSDDRAFAVDAWPAPSRPAAHAAAVEGDGYSSGAEAGSDTGDGTVEVLPAAAVLSPGAKVRVTRHMPPSPARLSATARSVRSLSDLDDGLVAASPLIGGASMGPVPSPAEPEWRPRSQHTPAARTTVDRLQAEFGGAAPSVSVSPEPC